MIRKIILIFTLTFTSVLSLSACSTDNNSFNLEIETETIEDFEQLKTDKKLYKEAKEYADKLFKNMENSDKIILFENGAYIHGLAIFIDGNNKQEYNSNTDKSAITVSQAKEITISKYIKGEIKHETT